MPKEMRLAQQTSQLLTLVMLASGRGVVRGRDGLLDHVKTPINNGSARYAPLELQCPGYPTRYLPGELLRPVGLGWRYYSYRQSVQYSFYKCIGGGRHHAMSVTLHAIVRLGTEFMGGRGDSGGALAERPRRCQWPFTALDHRSKPPTASWGSMRGALPQLPPYNHGPSSERSSEATSAELHFASPKTQPRLFQSSQLELSSTLYLEPILEHE